MPYALHDKTSLSYGDIADAKFHSRNPITTASLDTLQAHDGHVPPTLPMFATWLYDENIKKLFLAYKNKGAHIIAYKFAHAVYSTLVEAMRFVQMHRTVHNENVCIVPLSAHPKHEKKLGFSHTGIISRYLAFLFQCRHVSILSRTHSQIQKQLNKHERWKNMHDALRLKRNAHKAIHNAEVIVLFDDVITTGATMHASHHILQKAFPDTCIIGVALSRVKRK